MKKRNKTIKNNTNKRYNVETNYNEPNVFISFDCKSKSEKGFKVDNLNDLPKVIETYLDSMI